MKSPDDKQKSNSVYSLKGWALGKLKALSIGISAELLRGKRNRVKFYIFIDIVKFMTNWKDKIILTVGKRYYCLENLLFSGSKLYQSQKLEKDCKMIMEHF